MGSSPAVLEIMLWGASSPSGDVYEPLCDPRLLCARSPKCQALGEKLEAFQHGCQEGVPEPSWGWRGQQGGWVGFLAVSVSRETGRQEKTRLLVGGDRKGGGALSEGRGQLAGEGLCGLGGCQRAPGMAPWAQSWAVGRGPRWSLLPLLAGRPRSVGGGIDLATCCGTEKSRQLWGFTEQPGAGLASTQ